jgi:ribosome biogenesis GTPase
LVEYQGLVLKGIRGNYSVCDEKGTIYPCRAAASLFHKNSIVVGDFVLFQKQEGKSWITKILTRKNQIPRTKQAGKSQILFANLDQVFLLDALNQPHIDFILGCAYAFSLEKIKPIILLTKKDLVDESVCQKILCLYQSAKLTTLAHSTLDQGLQREFFIKQLENKTSLFFGKSGVGKTSLLNYLFPKMNLKTRGLQKNMSGRHTTTKTEIYQKPNNIFIADSPGIQDFSLQTLDKKQIAKNFFLFSNLAENCFFKDCLHNTEPKCAIKKAVDEKKYPRALYQHYLNLIQKD